MDYLTKPFQAEEVLIRLKTHLQNHRLTQMVIKKNKELEAANERLRAEVARREQAEQSLRTARDQLSLISELEGQRWGISGLIGRSPAMAKVIETLRKLQPHPATSVLIVGESGTGKELTGYILPLGAEKEVRVEVRIVAATNADLQEATAAGKFRQDLYFRLACFIADVPPLRDRREDIRLLVEHFLSQLSAEMGLPKPGVSAQAMATLANYDYPGNIRELRNLLERALIESGGDEINPPHLHFFFAGNTPRTNRAEPAEAQRSSADEQRILSYVREHGSINNTQCRELLGVGIHRAWYLLRKLQRNSQLVQDSSRRWAQYRLG